MKEIFPTADIFATPQKLDSSNERIPDGWQLGRVMLADGKRIAIIEQPEPPSTNLIRNRVGVRNRVSRLIDHESATGVLAVFTQEDNPNFRFSFVAREATLVFFEDGARTVTSETASKRFTYYLGPDEACTTPAQRFEQLYRLGATADLSHLIEAFSVEKLNKEFFSDFSRAVGLVSYAIEHKHFHLDENACRVEAQTLLNRLVFLYFVQRKGWLNRSRSFLIDAFRPHKDKNGATFYQSFLAPLFECLSTEPVLAPPFPDDVPFLNGGLFSDEAGAKDTDIQLRRKLDVPNSVFKEVFDGLLERYNFTIVEDSPSSVEVAIDPEMLGQVFEALVLQREESASGGKSRRHDTGSHYTPRPIVHYLCREILAGWLESRVPFDGQPEGRRKIDTLLALDATEGVDEQTSLKLQSLLTAEEAESLAEQLIRLRMCDPAVGSGAFPLGFLHEMLNLLRLCETRSSGRDPAEGDPTWLYDTKKKIIERVIYGVDLQAEAIELCRLRLWLSLMVDHVLKADPFNCSKTAFQKALRQLEPLPNLDFKIRPANSLIDLIHGQRLRLDAASLPGDSRNHVRGLAEAKHLFYNASKAQDKRCARRAIHTHYAALVLLALTQERSRYTARVRTLNEADLAQFSAIQKAEKETSSILKLLDASKREKVMLQDKVLQEVEERLVNQKNPTFLWPFDFAEVFFPLDCPTVAPPTLRGNLSLINAVAGQMELIMGGHLNPHGFDLVIGNPPYVKIQTLRKEYPDLADYYKKRFRTAAKGNYDIYVCFVERGMELLHGQGQLAYVVPHKFFNNEYGTALRSILASCHALRHIVHFGALQIFPGATNYVCLLFLTSGGSASMKFSRVRNYPKWLRDQSAETQEIDNSTITEAAWNFGSAKEDFLLDVIQSKGKRLLDLPAQMSRGSSSGDDDVFMLPFDANEVEHEILRVPVFAKDFGRYRFEPNKAWKIIYPYHKTPKGMVLIQEDELKVRFPKAYAYLTRYKAKLNQRKGARTWYGYSAARNLELHDTADILIPLLAARASFAMIPREMTGTLCPMASGGFTVSVSRKAGLSAKYVLAILNSPITFWILLKTSSDFSGGWITCTKQYFGELPIPTATATQEMRIVRLVDWIMWLYQQGSVVTGRGSDAATDPLVVAYLEQWVNGLVYELFFPSELHAAKIRMFDLTEKLIIPDVASLPESVRLNIIRKEFLRLYDENGALRSALFTLGTLPEVRIIEGIS